MTVSDATTQRPPTNPHRNDDRGDRSLASSEIDTRLAGMVVALLVIWIAFNVLSGGNFLTSRNLWNLSVQSASIAIMATGMVLIIVSRNIDLSVGSLLGLLGYVMAMVQTRWIPDTFGLGFDRPCHLDHRPRGGTGARRRHRCCAGLRRRLRGRARVHRHPRRLPGLARPHLPHG